MIVVDNDGDNDECGDSSGGNDDDVIVVAIMEAIKVVGAVNGDRVIVMALINKNKDSQKWLSLCRAKVRWNCKDW